MTVGVKYFEVTIVSVFCDSGVDTCDVVGVSCIYSIESLRNSFI